MWLSLVERLVWDQDVVGSNPAIPTKAPVAQWQSSSLVMSRSSVQSGPGAPGPDGEMANTLALGASAERFVGSSPTQGTTNR